MEEHLGGNIRSPPPDHAGMTAEAAAAEDACGRVLTGTDSDESSSLTSSSSVFCSSSVTVDSSPRNENELSGPASVWTNEKHNLYLDSLETSFIAELHRSIRVRGCVPEMMLRSNSSSELPVDVPKSSHQLLFVHDGRQQNIGFASYKHLLESRADSRFLQETSWMHPFSSAGKRHPFSSAGKRHSGASYNNLQEQRVSCGEEICLGGNSVAQYGSATGSEQQPVSLLRHQDLSASTIEVSDQNFVDEEVGDMPIYMPMAKRSKTVVTDASSNDQVVPLEKSNPKDACTVGLASSRREEQMQQELLSGNPDTFVRPKSDLSYFLRGS